MGFFEELRRPVELTPEIIATANELVGDLSTKRESELESDLKKITAERDQLATLLLQAFKDLIYLAQTCGSSYSLTALHRMAKELDDMGVPRPEVKL